MPLFLRFWSPRGVALGVIACGGALAMLVSFPDSQLRLLDRAVEVSSDESLTTRLVNPWIAIDHIWQHDPLGVQQKSIDEYAVANHLPIISVQFQVASGDTVIVTRPAFIDNGMLNMLLYHGLFALPIICLLVYCLQLRSYTHIAYFLLIGQFNGDWLSPDKIGALTLVVVLSSARIPLERSRMATERPDPP